MLVFEVLHDVDFGGEGLDHLGVFEVGHGHLFYGDVVVGGGFLYFVDNPVGSCAQLQFIVPVVLALKGEPTLHLRT